MTAAAPEEYVRSLAELIVRFGANVQPGQVVALGSEPGKEPLARAVVEAAYKAGAKFVDQSVFDIHLKRLRAKYADPATLGFVPPWYGQRVRGLGELRGASIALSGPVAPLLMGDVDPARLGMDMLPSVRESAEVLNQRTVNWTAAPCPTPGWADVLYPELPPEARLGRLWREIAHVCRLDTPDPMQAWSERLATLRRVAARLDGLGLDAVRFDGPGTELTVGLLPSSCWQAATVETVGGIVHAPNLPTEEVFTTPDPRRASGTVTATKPLFASGALILGLRVRFEEGRAVEIGAEQGAATIRTLAARDAGAARLGEIALVDGRSRIGELGTVFLDTLLDENAASHVALGQAYEIGVADPADVAHINSSELHLDFMIGSTEVAVTGVRPDGTEIPLLRGGAWQI